eukprot:TRINITY_DN17911_c0_g1_i1.p1 TRINITY_DN17911_c0_g1~~TRINITY_DN17911_c0_g1_i1.p1  ORF type:complete len:349 (-),score=65.90 TRINITY_DN17911_c0_g1_i1:928-1974(-)
MAACSAVRAATHVEFDESLEEMVVDGIRGENVEQEIRSLDLVGKQMAAMDGSMAMSEGGGILGVKQVGWKAVGNVLANQRAEWKREQEQLRRKLITEDDFPWQLPLKPGGLATGLVHGTGAAGKCTGETLKLVGGVDISFSKDDADLACAALVVMDVETMRIVYEAYEIVRMTLPYIPGYLAFRECSAHVRLLKQLAENQPHLMPQVVLVDGNGLLHPRGFGLACHLGVVADVPTIGIGKNLHHVDGLQAEKVRHVVDQRNKAAGDYVELVGASGRVWGAALKSHAGATKPVMVSVGHRISLRTAIEVVKRCCRYRVPEPVRQADVKSREYLRLRVDSVATPSGAVTL